MTGIPRAAFGRALAELDRDEFGRFVADLWAARGFRTEYRPAGGVVLARRDGARDLALYVSTGDPPDDPAADPAAEGGGRDGEVDRVDVAVVIGGPLDAPPPDGSVRCIGPDELHRMAMYAIDRPALEELCRAHFGAPPAALTDATGGPGGTTGAGSPAAGPTGTPDSDDGSPNGGPTWPELPDVLASTPGVRGRRGVVGAVAVSVAVVVAAVLLWAGGAAPTTPATGTGVPADAGEPTPSTARATATNPGSAGTAELASPGADGVTPAAAGCPAPPANASVRDLRPRIDDEDALDGWRVLSSRTVTRFDLMERSDDPAPEAAYVARYRGPDGVAYDFELDEWANRSVARAVATGRSTTWPVWVVWDRYSFGVRGNKNGTALSTSLTRAAARELLSAVRVPGGGTLGVCVDDLIPDRG